jgi:RimJ/RimL family protein N-acetyltransferase
LIWVNAAIDEHSNKSLSIVIVEIGTAQPIGYFQFTEINYINSNAMLVIVIGEKDWQGKGLGKEIVELGLNYAFNFLSLNKISLNVLEDNAFAIRLYEKLGFIIEGVLKKQIYQNDFWKNLVIMSLFKAQNK